MTKLENPKYLPTIGIECHVQLKTKTKLFSAVAIADYDAAPNTLISQICLGMPGALPVLNKAAVELAMRAAYMLNTTPELNSHFDRKHYFYPDLPKGYQITQFEQPIIAGGFVDVKVNNVARRIRINRAHIEEDAGKTIHPSGKDYSLIDLNRAGTPLLEIVTEPDIHSAEEARVFARELYLLARFADISDADLYRGNMRFDVNVSISSRPGELGTRSETKNLNSFRSVEKAVIYEIKRQTELLNKGERVVQETRGWDEAKQKTTSQRSKEEAHDYRYFPEPDVPPLELSQEFADKVKKKLPLMPNQLRAMLQELELDDSSVETLVEEILAGKFMQQIMKNTSVENAKKIANWLTTNVQGMVVDQQLTWLEAKLDLEAFIKLSNLTLANQLSSSAARTVLAEMVISGGDPEAIAQRLKLMQITDESALEDLVKQVLKTNKKAADDFRNGGLNALGFLIGQVMALSKGQADPRAVKTIIEKTLVKP